MELGLFYITDPINKMNKELTRLGTRVIRMKQDENIRSPKIIILNDKNLNNCNYAFIDVLKRYYFITNKRYLNNNHVELSLKTDVLMTYKNDINKSKELSSKEGVEIQTHKLESNIELPENENSYVILTIGK